MGDCFDLLGIETLQDVFGHQNTNRFLCILGCYEDYTECRPFLSRTAAELTCEVKPWDAGKRRRDGVPLVIHHRWATPVEDHILEYWGDRITSHFRVGFEDLAK